MVLSISSGAFAEGPFGPGRSEPDLSPPVPCTYTVAEQRSPGNLIVGLRRSGQIAKINTSACGGGGGEQIAASYPDRARGYKEERRRTLNREDQQPVAVVGTLSFFVFSLSLSCSLPRLHPSLSILRRSLLFYGEWKY